MTAMFSNLLDKLNLSSKQEDAPLKDPSDEEVHELREKYSKEGQEHVFAFYDNLTKFEKARLYEQLCSIDPARINEIAGKALRPPKSSENEKELKLEPLPESATASLLDESVDVGTWSSVGLKLIAENSVAVVLMAGGQGTRLGSSAPKGCFNIGLPSEKSLFQIQGERIHRIQKLASKEHGPKNVVVPWYVMTSGPTREPTQKFFEEHDYFGLQKENVMIFEQGVLPCISNEGKILLESKSKAFTAFIPEC